MSHDLLNTNLIIEEVISRINAGADVNQTDPWHQHSTLHFHQNIDVLKTLIKHGANVNHIDSYNVTPLCCIEPGNIEKAKLLIKHGARIEIKNDKGYQVLVNNNNYPTMFDLLLKNGADIYSTDELGSSIIHGMYNIKLLKLCLRSGIDVNSKDAYKNTPLHILAREEYLDAIEYLLDNGADINAINDNGRTPLYEATNYLEIGTVSMLLRKNANPNIRDKYGYTPLSYVEEIKIKKLLIMYGAVPSTVEFYQGNRELFSNEQQKAFDAYASLTSMDNDFFQMCLAYQNGPKNNISMEIPDVEFSISH